MLKFTIKSELGKQKEPSPYEGPNRIIVERRQQ